MNVAAIAANSSSEGLIVTEEKRSSAGRRRVDRIDRRKPAEKADNWLAEERRKAERREGERRTAPACEE